MNYKKNESVSYNPHIIQLVFGNNTVAVNYSEITDESCLEFSHVHSDFEIYYCLEGTMHLMAGDDCIKMKRNMFTIIGPGKFHHTLYEPKLQKRYFIMVFESPVKCTQILKGDYMEHVNQYLNEAICHIEKERILTLSDRFECHRIIERLEREMNMDLPGRNEMIRSIYTEYLIHIFRNLDIYSGRHGEGKNVEQGNVNLALELTRYMHNNYSKNISVRDAAENFHISERHVGRVFDKYFGKSFKHTLNVFRINYAKNYLLDTSYSIEKIAGLVGVSSIRTFNQLFREMENMSPTEYREIHKGDTSHYGVPKE